MKSQNGDWEFGHLCKDCGSVNLYYICDDTPEGCDGKSTNKYRCAFCTGAIGAFLRKDDTNVHIDGWFGE